MGSVFSSTTKPYGGERWKSILNPVPGATSPGIEAKAKALSHSLSSLVAWLSHLFTVTHPSPFPSLLLMARCLPPHLFFFAEETKNDIWQQASKVAWDFTALREGSRYNRIQIDQHCVIEALLRKGPANTRIRHLNATAISAWERGEAVTFCVNVQSKSQIPSG